MVQIEIFRISWLRRELSPTRYAQVARAQLTGNYVQYSERLLRATCCVPRGTEGQLGYWVWQSWNRIYFSFTLMYEAFTHDGGEETGVPEKKT